VSAPEAAAVGARHTVVIGGGVAGIAAALDCAEGGAAVTLVEVRPRLGGAAYSFDRDGMQIDNGQHVFLRCCSAYRELLARLGSDAGVFLQPRLDIPVLRPRGAATRLARTALPAPAHLAGALMQYRAVSVRERLRAGFAAAALARVDERDDRVDEQSFGAWLAAHGQSERAISNLWDLVALPTLNVRAAEASLALAAFVFKTGLLGAADAGDIGFHVRPLSEVIGEPALGALQAAGVKVLLGRRARKVEARDAEVHVVLDDASELAAETAIVAVPHRRAAELLPDRLADVAGRLRALGTSPIVNVHVIYDRPVAQIGFAAGVETPVQYVFDRSAAVGLPAGRYLAVSLSGADQEMEMDVERLRERFLPALAELFPDARAAKVERVLVTREHAATFRAVPGSGALRPPCRTAVPGLMLAGAYTDTGWPATLEGAVRSGRDAARAALAVMGLRAPPSVRATPPASRTSGGSAVGAHA
jgi:squalene-associated FAD-dependent desaturase